MNMGQGRGTQRIQKRHCGAIFSNHVKHFIQRCINEAVLIYVLSTRRSHKGYLSATWQTACIDKSILISQ